MERLQKFLARSGVGSRRRCEELIAAGLVRVNGRVVREMGFKVDPGRDRVEVRGKEVKPEKKVYLLLYKPRGVVTTLRDPQGRRTVLDLLDGVGERVYPVGRLDYDTEGLLLLTNDGSLAWALTHPRHGVPKTYLARVKGVPSAGSLRQMAAGLPLDDGLTSPARVRLRRVCDGDAFLEITICEGRNRQVRRMCEYIGHPVKSLKRIRIGPLTLDGLRPGQFRRMSRQEVLRLKKYVGLD